LVVELCCKYIRMWHIVFLAVLLQKVRGGRDGVWGDIDPCTRYRCEAVSTKLLEYQDLKPKQKAVFEAVETKDSLLQNAGLRYTNSSSTVDSWTEYLGRNTAKQRHYGVLFSAGESTEDMFKRRRRRRRNRRKNMLIEKNNGFGDINSEKILKVYTRISHY